MNVAHMKWSFKPCKSSLKRVLHWVTGLFEYLLRGIWIAFSRTTFPSCLFCFPVLLKDLLSGHGAQGREQFNPVSKRVVEPSLPSWKPHQSSPHYLRALRTMTNKFFGRLLHLLSGQGFCQCQPQEPLIGWSNHIPRSGLTAVSRWSPTTNKMVAGPSSFWGWRHLPFVWASGAPG